MINITTKIHNKKYIHAASYNESTGEIKLNCNSLTFDNYYVDINNQNKPTKENVTCKECLTTL
jgi:hypothetical protein